MNTCETKNVNSSLPPSTVGCTGCLVTGASYLELVIIFSIHFVLLNLTCNYSKLFSACKMLQGKGTLLTYSCSVVSFKHLRPSAAHEIICVKFESLLRQAE